jgi:DNA-binding MarR family transcriptional regulator
VAPPPLGDLLFAVLLAADDAGRSLADRLGTGRADATALQHLIVRGPTGPVDLGRVLGIGSAAATALADRLERAGHIERRPHPEDRRRLQLVPTEQAERDVWRVLEPLLTRLGAVETGLDAAERDAVARYLTAVAGAYREYRDAPG